MSTGAFTCAAYKASAITVLFFTVTGCRQAPHQAALDWAAPKYDADFWKTWGDGQAEVSGYELTYPRYGQLRRGNAVTIFVTEMFSNRDRVKAEPGKHPRDDEFPVMKLNLVKDFQTGVYDYNLMLSAFATLAAVGGRPAGALTKASFSSQEWCGHVFGQLLFDPASIRLVSHSYFDGESDQQRTLDYPGGSFSEDGLLLWARGLAGPALNAGETKSIQLLTSLETARMNHIQVTWRAAVLSRGGQSVSHSSTSGTYNAELYAAKIAGGPTVSIWVEVAAPHHVLEWESSTGEHARLLRSKRMKYWTLNREGGESALQGLGLDIRPPHTM